MGVRLPPEYQEVEYIQSTGTQWLDTGVKPRDNSNFKISFRARRFSNPGGQGNYIYGTSGNWCSMEYYSSSLNWNTGSTTHAVLITAPAINKDFDFEIDYGGSIMKLSGFYSGSKKYSGALGSGNLVFFAKSANTNMYPLRLYNLKIRQGDNYPLIRDFVPCYRKADSKPGMYDLVSGTFFVNQGTGEFLVGSDVIGDTSPWLMERRRLLMQNQKYGPNLLALSDFTRRTESGTCVIDDQTGIITVSGSNRYAGISTPTRFVGSHLIVGHTYEMHCRLVSATNASLARFSIRGKRGNENQVAYSAIPTAVGAEASVVFTVDEYMSYFTLFATWTDTGSQTIAYSDVWVKEILS